MRASLYIRPRSTICVGPILKRSEGLESPALSDTGGYDVELLDSSSFV